MALYADGPSTDPTFHEHDGVLEWLAHPEERGERASHAMPGDEGLWLVDPLDAPGLDDRLAELGEVAGVVVCTKAHARDAGAIARRHDVPVHLPFGLERAAARVDAPVTWTAGDRIDPAIGLHVVEPLPGWVEAVLVGDDALYVPELLGTAPQFRVGDERLGASVFVRPVLPTEPFEDLAPSRLFFGHGRAITDDAAATLAETLAGAPRRFPRALAAHLPEQTASIVRNVVLDG